MCFLNLKLKISFALMATPLLDPWTMWVKYTSNGSGTSNYSTAFTEMCSFSTIEEFWSNWNHIPSPGKVFFDGNDRKGVGPDGRLVEEFCVFKKGIQPAWEDPANKDGGDFSVRVSLKPEQLDIYFLNTVLAMIGNQLCDDDNICGVRVVDKSAGKGAMCRFELWIKHSDDRKIAIKAAFEKCLPQDSVYKKIPSFEWRGRSGN